MTEDCLAPTRFRETVFLFARPKSPRLRFNGGLQETGMADIDENESATRVPRFARRIVHLLLTLGFLAVQMGAAPQFDFTQSGGATGWLARHDVGPLKLDHGLIIPITGNDPYIEGPVLKLVTRNPVQVRMRLKSEVGGNGQIYWMTSTPSENQSVWYSTVADEWTDVCIPLPPLDKGTRLRLDPPGTKGKCTVAWLQVEEMNVRGITRIVATKESLELTIQGFKGEVEIAELAPYQSLTEAITAPVVHRAQFNVNGKCSVPRFEMSGDVQRDRLYSAFVPVQEIKGSGRVPVGPAHFVDEFNAISKYEAPFPTSTSKKGLQIQMVDDALKLGVQHAAFNLDLSAMVDLGKNPANLEWKMDGEKYYFNRAYVESLPVKQLSDAGCVVTAIVLSYQSGNPATDTVMLHPSRAATLPNRLAAFNTVTADGLRHYKACFEFLTDRFSRSDGTFGRVANWIIGNEVSAHWEWYNMGLTPREMAVAEYERSVRLAHTAVRKASSSSRVYLSLEHHWTLTFGGDPMKAVAGRRFIEEFNRRARMGGNFEWNLAYHPYPEDLFQPRTWRDKSATASAETPRITFKNLDQLASFFKRPELQFDDHPRRIILSEQGFHSDGTPAGDLAQAAAYCYAYKKVARMDAIDSFILHRHVDHSGEGGLNLGLWQREPNSVANPSTPRPMYQVFLKASTPEEDEAFKFALPVIGIKKWDEIAPKR